MDFKSALQENLQASGRQASYVLVKEVGPEHSKTFTVEVRLSSPGLGKVEFVGRAEGTTKKKAEQASNETEKAQAEAEQAKAEQQATESKAAVARDCAKAYLSAFGTLVQSDDAEAEADAVRKQLSSITDECKQALAGT